MYFASFDLEPVFRRAQRLAYEQQRARAEADHRKYLEMSGKMGGPQPNTKPTYKLSMGSRKNVKKSDSGNNWSIMDIMDHFFVLEKRIHFLMKHSANMDNLISIFAK